MIRKEQLYEQILEQIDLTKETDDEELQELIRTVLDEAADEEIKLEIGTYYTGKGLYIGMLAKEDGVWESFSDLTVNLPFERSDVHEAFIQDFGSKEKLKFIQKHKLGKILPERGHSGFCTYAKVAFDLKRLEELDPEGMKRFYKDHPELEEQSQVPKKKKRNQMER